MFLNLKVSHHKIIILVTIFNKFFSDIECNPTWIQGYFLGILIHFLLLIFFSFKIIIWNVSAFNL